ncbi:MAG TPA: efflux RND transporter periplasmic adaptor subunit [Burkholderiales bacterium]|nr:efflux RND transporter periplasmic adaptor subunit [Burkholderiales bacterium]
MNAHAACPASRSARAARCLVSLAAVALLFGCGQKGEADAQKKGPGAGGPPPAMPVTVVKVEPRRVPIALEAVGQAEGSREVEVRARVSGIVEKRAYSEGEPVKAGAVLFLIDRKPYEIALAQAKAALSEAKAREENARREADRLKSLVDSKAISQREYDQAVSTLQQSTASIEGAQAKVAEAQLNLSYTSVTAPINGITGRAVRSEGSLVAANTDSSLLTTISQVNPVWVRFSVAEAEFDRIRSAQKSIKVKLASQDGKVTAGNGRLNFAASTVDTKLGTVQLRAEFPNPDLQWMPGQFVKVQIQAGEQQAMLVPQAAVMQSEQGYAVWVVGPDNSATMRPIKTANWLGSDWIVVGGLNAGDAVIVDNLMKIRPGAKVQPHGPQPAGAASGGQGQQAPAGAQPAQKQDGATPPAVKQDAATPPAKSQDATPPAAKR